jgi:hypothetical protein
MPVGGDFFLVFSIYDFGGQLNDEFGASFYD